MHRLRDAKAQLSADPVDVTAAASPALARDRVTWLAYAHFALFGYFLYAFTPSVNLLRSDEHTSRAVSGLHGTGMAVGAIAVGIVAPRLVRRFGRRALLWGSLATMCSGVAVLTSCRVVPVTILGAAIGSFGGTLMCNLSATILTTHHGGTAGGAAITEGSGVGSALGILAPLLLAAAIAIHLGWRAGMLLVVAFGVGAYLAFAKVQPPDDPNVPRRTSHQHVRLPREFWRASGVLVMTTAIEFSMTIWSSDVLQNHLRLSKGIATAGVTAIIVGMTAGRLLFGRFTLRYSIDALLLAAFGLTATGFLVFWFSTHAALAFGGLFLTGVGIALHYPLAVTRVIRLSGGHADLAISHATRGTGLAVAVAPFGLGAIADHVGSHTAMLLVPLFVAVAVIGVVTTRRPAVSAPIVVAPVAAGG